MLKQLYIPITRPDIINYDNLKDNATGTKNIQDALINHMLINNSMNFGDSVLALRLGRNLPDVEILASMMGTYDFIVDKINHCDSLTDDEKLTVSSAFKKIGMTKIDNAGNTAIDSEFIDDFFKFMMIGHKEVEMSDTWKVYKMSARHFFNKREKDSSNLNDYPDVIYPLSIVSRLNREDPNVMLMMCESLTKEEEEETKRRIKIFKTNYDEYIDVIKKLPDDGNDSYKKILKSLENYNSEDYIREREIKRTWYLKELYKFIDTLAPENKPLRADIIDLSNLTPYSTNEAHLDTSNCSSFRYIHDILEQLPDSNPTKKQILSQLGMTVEEIKAKMEEEMLKKPEASELASIL